jgi:peptidylprolyl isomerase
MLKKVTILALLAAVTLSPTYSVTPKTTKTDSGLQIIEIKEGTGPTPKSGDTVRVHYTGTLPNGTKFDSSRDRNEPFEFTLGQGQVIKGWDEGIALMKVGGRSNLIIPSELGYGAQGAGGKIPPNTALHFDVELIGIQGNPAEKSGGTSAETTKS